jgi:hypothetical protein
LILLLGLTARASAGGPLPLQGVGRGHTARIYRGVFTPDSKTFLSVGIDGVVRAWNVANGSPAYILAGHTGPIHGIGLAGKNTLVSGGENGDLLLWDLAARKQIGMLGKTRQALHALAVAHNGKLVATGGGDWKKTAAGELHLWDLQARREIVALKGHRRLILGVAFSPNDELLAAVDFSGDLHVWNLATRKPIVTLYQENPAGAVSFSPDGKFLVVGDYKGRLNVWDTTHWLDEGVVRGHPGGVMWLKYSPKGNMLASAGWDGTVKLWNGHDVEALPAAQIAYHRDKAWMVAFSPDERTLATAGEDKLVNFFRIAPAFTRRYVPPQPKAVAPPIPVRKGDARIALVAAHPLGAVRTLQDLALVRLSDEKGVVLLQRNAIEKILAEQKLTQSGLVEAKHAVQLGKVLAVDLIGVIDASLETREATGLVVFDAASGARLYDDEFPRDNLEEQLRAVAKGVQTAMAKWRAGYKHVKTVCVLPARNADLPRGMDSYCDALGATLERRLVHHPGIVTLERKWLDSVNQEKSLAAAAQMREVLASVLVVDVEIARGSAGTGLRGTVTLRDNAGKALHRFEHQVADDAGDLLGPLTKRLHEVLNTAHSDALVKPSREARRFLRESEMLWKYGHFRRSLRAAEAAYALVQDDDTRVRLAECLLNYPREMWRKHPALKLADRPKFAPVERTAEEVRAGLSMLRRGQQLVDSAKPRVQAMPDHAKPVWFSLAESGECARADLLAWQAMAAIMIKPADPSIAEELREFRNTAIRRHLERVQEIAGMKRWPHRDRLQRLTPGLRTNIVEAIVALAPDVPTRQKALRDAVHIWLDVSRPIPVDAFPAAMVFPLADGVLSPMFLKSVTSKRSPAGVKADAAILQEMRTHPYPAVRLYGRHFAMKGDLAAKQITLQEAEIRLRTLIDDGKRLLDTASYKNPVPHRVAIYECFQFILADAESSFSAALINELNGGILEYMLDRKDVPGQVTARLLGHNLVVRGKLHIGLDTVHRFKELYAARSHRLFHDPGKKLPKQFKQYETTILQIDPTLAKHKLEPPWEKVTPLVNLNALTHASRLYAPLTHDRHVYFLAGVHDPADKNRAYLQLHRVAVDGGGIERLGKLPVTLQDYAGKNPRYAFGYANCVTHSLIHGTHFVAGTARDGVFLLPLAGGTPVRIGDKEGLPALTVTALAALDGKVFAALAGGYLVQIDVDSRRVQVLASARRINKLSPFDNDRPFRIRTILADPKRQRLLFPVGVGSLVHPNVGLWEFNLTTRQFKKHLRIAWVRFSNIQGDVVYLEHTQYAWLAQFDLAKDQFTLLKGRTPNGVDKQTPRGLPAPFYAKFPERLYHAGYLWETSPFQRRSLTINKEEFLPHPARGYTLQVYVRECLEPIGTNMLLVGDRQGLYVVQLKVKQ